MEGLTCFWAYEGMARKLIKQAKYRFYFDFLGELLRDVNNRVSEMPEYSSLNGFMENRPVIVPVPLYPKRERERGFNQAEVIGRLVAGRWSLELKNLLSRIRDTGRQVGRDRTQRLDAMKDAFLLKTKDQLPKTILLVDDVWTTGATMNECAGVLKRAGVRFVWGLVLAR
jgi:ComF family protein